MRRTGSNNFIKDRRKTNSTTKLSDQDYKRIISEEKGKISSKHRHGDPARFQYDLDHRKFPGWLQYYGILVLDSNLSKTCEDCGKKKPRFTRKGWDAINSTSRRYLEILHKQVCVSRNNRRQKEQSNGTRNGARTRSLIDGRIVEEPSDSTSDTNSTVCDDDDLGDLFLEETPSEQYHEEEPNEDVTGTEIEEVAALRDSIPEFLKGEIEKFETKRVKLDDTIRGWENEIEKHQFEIESLHDSIKQCEPDKKSLGEIIEFMRRTSDPRPTRVLDETPCDPRPTNERVDDGIPSMSDGYNCLNLNL